MKFNKKKILPSAISRKSIIFEVYKTEETETSTTQSTTLATSEETETTTENEGFKYDTGRIIDATQFQDIYSVDWSEDYAGFTGEASIKMPYRKDDMIYLHKGAQCKIYVTRIINETDPLLDVFHGFINDLSFSENGLDLSLVSYSKILESTVNLSYQQLPRSQILTNVIKSYGLIPKVDPTGLRDEIIDWSSVENSSSSKDTQSSEGGDSSNLGDGSMTEDEINKLASKVKYVRMGSGHDPKKGFNNLTKDFKGDCYDISAGLYYAFNFKAGIPARDIVATSKYSNSGTHHCCQIKKDGQWVFPEFYDHCTTNLKVNSPMKSNNFDVAREPPSSNGKIPSYCASCKKKWP